MQCAADTVAIDRRRLRAAWLAGVVALAVCLVARAGNADDPRQWVQRMNQALASSNYDGVFVHQYGDHREMLRIVHRIKDGRRSERLVSIDGQGREFIRDGNQTTYYFPDRRVAIIFGRRPANVGFIGGLPSLNGEVPASYEVRNVDRGLLHSFMVRQIWVTRAMPIATATSCGSTRRAPCRSRRSWSTPRAACSSKSCSRR